MKQIVECVPNFSEGRDLAVIEQITAEIKKIAGVELLDVDPGVTPTARWSPSPAARPGSRKRRSRPSRKPPS